ncbi:skin secretory protein xP2-like [Cavia porcellus]|uniref:skin secretory protein xP2-like n=1 Tax=Cavia porcellus TaxID=10141 RepID=UPI002FE16239
MGREIRVDARGARVRERAAAATGGGPAPRPQGTFLGARPAGRAVAPTSAQFQARPRLAAGRRPLSDLRPLRAPRLLGAPSAPAPGPAGAPAPASFADPAPESQVLSSSPRRVSPGYPHPQGPWPSA